MASDQISYENIFKHVEKSLNEEYPTLKVIFIADTGDDFAATIANQKHLFTATNASERLHEDIIIRNARDSKTTQNLGLAQDIKKHIIPFLSKSSSTAAIAIDVRAYSDPELLTADIYAALWPVLKLHIDVEHERSKNYTYENGIYWPKFKSADTPRRNMIADAFAAMTMELTNRKAMISHLAKLRCEHSFQKNKNFIPADNPYPISLDATLLVFQDLKYRQAANSGAIEHAFNMADEVNHTCQDQIINQWQSFINTAQKMVWCDAELKHTLGAAIYTCENTADRSTAYLVSEIMSAETAPLTHFEGFNAFADNESQERAHQKACADTLNKTLKTETEDGAPNKFLTAAIENCEKLLAGKPTGWCAPALIKAAKTYENLVDVQRAENTKTVFADTNNTIKWHSIRTVHDGIITFKKQGKEISLDSLIELLRRDEDMREAALTIRSLKELTAPSA